MPWHNGPIGLNVGVSDVATIIFMVALVAHPPLGAKVYVVVPVVEVFIVDGLHVPTTPLLEVV